MAAGPAGVLSVIRLPSTIRVRFVTEQGGHGRRRRGPRGEHKALGDGFGGRLGVGTARGCKEARAASTRVATTRPRLSPRRVGGVGRCRQSMASNPSTANPSISCISSRIGWRRRRSAGSLSAVRSFRQAGIRRESSRSTVRLPDSISMGRRAPRRVGGARRIPEIVGRDVFGGEGPFSEHAVLTELGSLCPAHERQELGLQPIPHDGGLSTGQRDLPIGGEIGSDVVDLDGGAVSQEGQRLLHVGEVVVAACLFLGIGERLVRRGRQEQHAERRQSRTGDGRARRPRMTRRSRQQVPEPLELVEDDQVGLEVGDAGPGEGALSLPVRSRAASRCRLAERSATTDRRQHRLEAGQAAASMSSMKLLTICGLGPGPSSSSALEGFGSPLQSPPCWQIVWSAAWRRSSRCRRAGSSARIRSRRARSSLHVQVSPAHVERRAGGERYEVGSVSRSGGCPPPVARSCGQQRRAAGERRDAGCQ